MIGYYNYSVILTYIGLASSIIGMVSALEAHPIVATICLMVSGLCDMFDGTIARRCKRNDCEKSFGIQIDSLCDLICFGSFPAIIVYTICRADKEYFDLRLYFTTACMIVYVLAAVIRLGFFNVSEINRTAEGAGKRLYYEGLPVTSVALLLPFILVCDLICKKYNIIHFRFYDIGLLIIGILFISKIKIRKLYFRGLLVAALFGATLFLLVIVLGRTVKLFG